MVISLYGSVRRMNAAAGLFVLVFLLVACGGGRGAGLNAPATAPVRAVSPTPTPTSSAAMITHNGAGFTMKYPKTWKVASSDSDAAFSDSQGKFNMTVGFTSNPSGAATADQLADGGIDGAKANLKNAQLLKIPSTTTIAGQIWSQRAIRGTSTVNGQSQEIEAMILATNYPKASSATKGYLIVYVAAKDEFDTANSRYFTPMLQSFKFTS